MRSRELKTTAKSSTVSIHQRMLKPYRRSSITRIGEFNLWRNIFLEKAEHYFNNGTFMDAK